MKVWRWRQAILKSELGSTTKLVLLALSTYMNDHGAGCYPSIDQIARDTSLSDRAVTTHIGNAEAAGFLIKKKRNMRGQLWDSNEYYASTPSDDEPRSPQNEGVNDIHPSSELGNLFEGRGESASPLKQPEGGTSFHQGVKDVPTNSPVNSPIKKDIYPEKGGKKYPEEFSQVWNIWPEHRRCEKPKAYAAWREACRSIHPTDLLEAVKRYLQTEEAKNKFAPYPAKWFKNERWLDFEGPQASAAAAMPSMAELGGDTEENRQFLRIMDALRQKLGDAVFRSWLQQLRVGHKNCTVLTLQAANGFNARWLKEHYDAEITSAVAAVWPEITTLEITARVVQ